VLAAGFTPKLNEQSKKSIQAYLKDKKADYENDKQIKIAAPSAAGKMTVKIITDRMLKAKQDGFMVMLTQEAKEAVQAESKWGRKPDKQEKRRSFLAKALQPTARRQSTPGAVDRNSATSKKPGADR